MSRSTGPGPESLREFLSLLRGAGQLVEVEAEVDPRLEIAEIHRRVIAAGGPALLFRNVRGGRHPVVTNLFGGTDRLDLAFGGRPERLVAELVEFARCLLPPSLGKLWKARTLLGQALRLGTQRTRFAPCLSADSPPQLTALPLTTSWFRDGGPTMTLPLVYTEPPDGGPHNLGIYRMQRYSDSAAGMHWQIGKGGGFHHARAEERGEPLAVTVFLGGPPAATVGALTPLPENIPELLVASLLLGKKLKVARLKDWPHPLLAGAEWCLLGHVPARERRAEGPFGDHYGTYSLEHDYPVFHCQRMLSREDPIYPATVVGKPRQEDVYLGDYVQKLLAPLIPLIMPAVQELWSYGESGYHSLAAAVVKERYRREAMAAAFRILGEGQLSLTKFLLVVDRPLELKSFPAVLGHVLARMRVKTDLFVFANLSMDSLDYAGPRINEGSKAVLLGLGEPVRSLPDTTPSSLPSQVRFARPFCPGCLVVEGPSFQEDPGFAQTVASLEALASWPLVVLSDEGRRAAASAGNFLWSTFTRFDPATDLHGRGIQAPAPRASPALPLVLDARRKPGYPDELFCDEETRVRVSRRWKEYFPGGMEMGDSDQANLDPALP